MRCGFGGDICDHVAAGIAEIIFLDGSRAKIPYCLACIEETERLYARYYRTLKWHPFQKWNRTLEYNPYQMELSI